jgi:hypothetical protein
VYKKGETMKRYTLGFVIVVITALSFFMHRASIRGAEASQQKPLSTLTINVDNQTDKDISFLGTYKKTIIKAGGTSETTTRTSNTIKAKSKGTVVFEPIPGYDWLEVTQATKPVVDIHTAEKPLATQSIIVK